MAGFEMACWVSDRHAVLARDAAWELLAPLSIVDVVLDLEADFRIGIPFNVRTHPADEVVCA
jgi:hypothetical protein